MNDFNSQIAIVKKNKDEWIKCLEFAKQIKNNETSFSDALSGTMTNVNNGFIQLKKYIEQLLEFDLKSIERTVSYIKDNPSIVKNAQESSILKGVKTVGLGVLKVAPIINVLYNIYASINYIHYSIATSKELEKECSNADFPFDGGKINLPLLHKRIVNEKNTEKMISLLQILKFVRFLTILGAEFEIILVDWVRDIFFMFLNLTGIGLLFDFALSIIINFPASEAYQSYYSSQYETTIADAIRKITEEINSLSAVERKIKSQLPEKPAVEILDLGI